MRTSFIERTTRVNVGSRVENHDDKGRDAVKAVPVTRIVIIERNKYKGNGAARDLAKEYMYLTKKERTNV